ncbi:MAG: hypothetical protein AAF307_07675 [Pseudomonadota bacterium]
MARLPLSVVALTAPLSIFSQAALADLTPAQVWADWRGYMESLGYEIIATEAARGGDLTVSDVVMTFATPDGESGGSLTFDSIALSQNNDGSVAIALPDTVPMTVTGNDGLPGSEDFTMTMNFTQTGQVLTASGDPDALTYLYTADTFGMTMDQVMMGGAADGQELASFAMTGANLRSTTKTTLGEMRGYDQSGSLENVAFDMTFQDPDDPNVSGIFQTSASSVSMTGVGMLPLAPQGSTDMAALIAAGFDAKGTLNYADGRSDINVTDAENGTFKVQTSSKSGGVTVDMSAAGIAYDVAQDALNAAVTMQGMPLPFEVAMAQSGFKIAVPIAKSDEPQDFALGITLGDLTLSDMIWGMFDPAGQLPRDPANIMLDITGKAKVLVDFLNPETAPRAFGAPGELTAVNLRNLLVSVAGARLESDGAITFDGAAAPMVPGLGSPVGAINIALAGGNGLMDKLVAMGFLPQDQAMGARMMMGLFAVPGDGPDTLKSKIEFTQDGRILANGQQIR